MIRGDESRWGIRYEVEAKPGGWTKAELVASGPNTGGADALIIISVMRMNETGEPWKGQTSSNLFSVGPDGKPLSDEEIFQEWTLMAHGFTQSKGLAESQRRVAFEAVQKIREMKGIFDRDPDLKGRAIAEFEASLKK